MKNIKLMEIATVFTFLLLFLLMYVPIPKDNVTIFVALGSTITGFYFGSSYQKEKNNTQASQDAAGATNTKEGIQ